MTGAGCRTQRRATIAEQHRRQRPRPRARADRPSPSRDPGRCRRRARRCRRRAAPPRARRAVRASGSRASRSTRAPTTNAAIPTGTFTRKTQRQLSCTSRPPIGGPGGGGDRAHRGPAGDGDRPLVRLELGQQQRERRRQHQRRSDRLDDARRDQRLDRPRRGAGGAGEREQREPGEEDALAPVRVGPAAGGDEQRGEDDRVRVEDPAQAAEAGAGELDLERREGDVDDEEVEARHEGAEADDDDGDASALRHRTDRITDRCVIKRCRLDSVAMLPVQL